MGREHEIKADPGPFLAAKLGLKRFEYLRDEPRVEVGDTLVLREFNALTPAGWTGDVVRCAVTYRQPGGGMGVPAGFCIVGLI